jgi:hypothetical protein
LGKADLNGNLCLSYSSAAESPDGVFSRLLAFGNRLLFAIAIEAEGLWSCGMIITRLHHQSDPLFVEVPLEGTIAPGSVALRRQFADPRQRLQNRLARE